MRLFSNTKMLLAAIIVIITFTILIGYFIINEIIPNGNFSSDGDGLFNKKAADVEWWRVTYLSKYIETEDEHPGWQQVMENTGITIQFNHPPYDQAYRQYRYLYAANNLPDITEHQDWLPPGGPDVAIDEERILRLNELIDKKAPNFKRILVLNPQMMQQLKTNSGTIWSFPMLQATRQFPEKGLLIRKDLREKVNVDVPVTIDDWETMLLKFRYELRTRIPLSVFGSTFVDGTGLFSAYGINRTYFLEDGVVHYSPLEQGFKEYITLMNKWYNLRLITGVYAKDEGYKRWVEQNVNYVGSNYGDFTSIKKFKEESSNSEYMLEPAPFPVLEKNDKEEENSEPFFDSVLGYHNAISATSNNVEDAIRLLDYCYSPEGYIIANYGREGDTYNIENDKVVYTYKITDNDEYNTLDASMMYLFHHGPFLRDYQTMLSAYEDYEQECMEVWGSTSSKAKTMPQITYTEEEEILHNKLMKDIYDYEQDMIFNFIRGEIPLEEYDEFIETLYNMEIEKCISITQAAYDRYAAR